MLTAFGKFTFLGPPHVYDGGHFTEKLNMPLLVQYVLFFTHCYDIAVFGQDNFMHVGSNSFKLLSHILNSHIKYRTYRVV